MNAFLPKAASFINTEVGCNHYWARETCKVKSEKNTSNYYSLNPEKKKKNQCQAWENKQSILSAGNVQPVSSSRKTSYLNWARKHATIAKRGENQAINIERGKNMQPLPSAGKPVDKTGCGKHATAAKRVKKGSQYWALKRMPRASSRFTSEFEISKLTVRESLRLQAASHWVEPKTRECASFMVSVICEREVAKPHASSAGVGRRDALLPARRFAYHARTLTTHCSLVCCVLFFLRSQPRIFYQKRDCSRSKRIDKCFELFFFSSQTCMRN